MGRRPASRVNAELGERGHAGPETPHHAPLETDSSQTYLRLASARLDRAAQKNRDSLRAAASILAATVDRGGVVYAFGSGHSQLVALEGYERPGGLAPIQVIYDPWFGQAENLLGYGKVLCRDFEFRPGDCLIVVSHSGLNASPIEVALAARVAGIPVIALTAIAFSRAGESRHPSGRRLFELADVALDDGYDGGDGTFFIDGPEMRVGPTSTVVGAALLNALVVEAISELGRRGLEPPLIRANSEVGGRAANARLRSRYRGRIRPIW